MYVVGLRLGSIRSDRGCRKAGIRLDRLRDGRRISRDFTSELSVGLAINLDSLYRLPSLLSTNVLAGSIPTRTSAELQTWTATSTMDLRPFPTTGTSASRGDNVSSRLIVPERDIADILRGSGDYERTKDGERREEEGTTKGSFIFAKSWSTRGTDALRSACASA